MDLIKTFISQTHGVRDALGRLQDDEDCLRKIEQVGEAIVSAAMNRCMVYICGNGGSAAQASHFAGELLGRYKKDRRAVGASALNDPSVLTCTANDYGYAWIFKRQLQGLIKPGDVVIFLTTSGESENVQIAAEWLQRECDFATSVAVTRSAPVLIGAEVDIPIYLPAVSTAVIQELTLRLIHFWCEVVDHELEGIGL